MRQCGLAFLYRLTPVVFPNGRAAPAGVRRIEPRRPIHSLSKGFNEIGRLEVPRILVFFGSGGNQKGRNN